MALARNMSTGAPAHIASALMRSGMSIENLRALSPLTEDAQKVIDNAVVQVGMDRLVIAADILAAGLTFNLTDPLSVLEVQWDSANRAGSARRVMNPSARGENQLPDRLPNRIPVYLTTDDFNMGIRLLKASERAGMPLDVTQVGNATRNVNEAIEDATINGAGVQQDGYTTPGLLNAPGANHFGYSGGTSWNTASGEVILANVMGMIAEAQTAKKWGPYNLYLPTSYGNAVNADFKANGSLTILQRIQALPQIASVKVADQLPADRTILMQMTSDVVDMIYGMAPTVIPWTSVDGFVLYWMVMAVMVPRVRADYNGASGIVVGNLTV